MSTQKKVVLITGCSEGGIGFQLAEQFAARGCVVYASARAVERMAALSAPIHRLALDVTRAESVEAAVAAVVRAEGRIDVLVNNAGLSRVGPLVEVPQEQVAEIFETNVFGVLRLTRAVFPHMAARKAGLIVNVGSVVGEIPTPWSGIYAASKAALHSLTATLAMESTPFGLSVMLVAPGAVRTHIAASSTAAFALAPSSLYARFLDNILDRAMQSTSRAGGLSADALARKVVARALGGARPPFFSMWGPPAGLWRLLVWLPRTWVMYVLWWRFGQVKGGK
ncbi:NAD-binding protein [Amylostereum chailletii]|nr:NAD-binding protein [Amylostereum chailletii]